jgi:hypothetical protein
MKKTGQKSIVDPLKTKGHVDNTRLSNLPGLDFPYNQESYTEEYVPGSSDTLVATVSRRQEELKQKPSSVHHLTDG